MDDLPPLPLHAFLPPNQRRSTNVEDWRQMPHWQRYLQLLTEPFKQGAQAMAHPFTGPETMPAAAGSQLARDAGIQDAPPLNKDFLWQSNQWGG